MTTFLSDKPLPGGVQLDPRGISQVEADRKRLGITDESLERSRDANLKRPF